MAIHTPNSTEAPRNGGNGASAGTPDGPQLDLLLHVDDAQTVGLLLQIPSGRTRDDHALTALRIGAMALEQARGRIDSDAIRREGDRLLELLQGRLGEHADRVNDRVNATRREYLDPQDGKFPERLRRLVDPRDGELRQVLDSAVASEGSTLAGTLRAFLGADSEIMRVLDPAGATGVVRAVEEAVVSRVNAGRDALLREFSLDNEQGALRRLVGEVEARHGKLAEAIDRKLGEVVAEFSLDDEGSALSRMAKQLEQTQDALDSQLSLDNAESALSRLLGVLTKALAEAEERNAAFRENLSKVVGELAVRKAAEARSTTHGLAFEEALGEQIRRRVEAVGDVFEHVGSRPGLIQRCKKGDLVVTLGPETAAPGARVVLEAKEDASFDVARAREELDQARKNRGAGVAVFVWSAQSAPKGTPVFQRFDNDLVLVWDADDAATDVVLDAAVSVARALCVREARAAARTEEEIADIELATLEIERRLKGYDEIQTWASTIRSNAEKIADRARKDAEAVTKLVQQIHDASAKLRTDESTPSR